MDDHGSPALRRLLDEHAGAVVATHAQHGDATAVVEPAQLVAVLRFLHDDAACAFDMLSDLCAVDLLPEKPRFEVVYHLLASGTMQRVRVKVRVAEDDPELDTAVPVWPAADWMEREVYDMYGIRFRGHPDLRRILMYDGFEGYPLRKDYPKERRQPLVGPRN